MLNTMDIVGVSNSLSKLDYLRREQELIVNDIKNVNFDGLYSNNFYSGFVNRISSNLYYINRMHSDNISYLEGKKNEYIEMSKFTSDEFRKLGE